MSLTIIWATPERVLVGVDTIARDMRGELFEAAKIFYIAHIAGAVFGRGSSGLLQAITHRLMEQPGLTFDQAAASAPAIIAEMAPQALQFMVTTTGAAGPFAEPQEVVIAGWSHEKRRMVCIGFIREVDGSLYSQEIVGAASGGWDDEAGPMPEPSSVDAMLAIATTITHAGRRKLPGYPVGGRLLVTELTRDGMSLVSRTIPEPETQHD